MAQDKISNKLSFFEGLSNFVQIKSFEQFLSLGVSKQTHIIDLASRHALGELVLEFIKIKQDPDIRESLKIISQMAMDSIRQKMGKVIKETLRWGLFQVKES